MEKWTVKRVSEWLKLNGFKKHIKAFEERSIDGYALMKLADEDITQLLVEVDENGMKKEPTIGTKSRFRTALKQWRMKVEQAYKNSRAKATHGSAKTASTNITDISELNTNKHQDGHAAKKSKTKIPDEAICEVTCSIDDEVHMQFFRNPKFVSHLINHVKQEASSTNIDVAPANSSDGGTLLGYSIKITGQKKQNRVVRNLIKRLFSSIAMKTYKQHQVKHWSFSFTLIDIIQNIFDSEDQMFTVCQWSRLDSRTLEVHYFNDEKFNSSGVLAKIEHTINNEIRQENFVLSQLDRFPTVEFLDVKTNKVLSKCEVAATERYYEELRRNLSVPEHGQALISVTRSPYDDRRSSSKEIIKIFGQRKMVTELFEEFKKLFDKYRLRKYKFNHISPEQFDYVATFCAEDLKKIERALSKDFVTLRIRQGQFSSPDYAKADVQNSIMNLLRKMKTSTFKSNELYFDVAEQLLPKIKSIACRNRCHCELKVKKKLKGYYVPKSPDSLSAMSSRVLEESNLFLSSPSVLCQSKLAKGSVEVLIGDIAAQKVDVIIVPSMFFGLKENLVERAGEIIELQCSSEENPTESQFVPVPFITETTAGSLSCKSILFVDWSLPSVIADESHLCDSIQSFVSKSFQYIATQSSQQADPANKTVAIAIPDLCTHEQVMAEEMTEETINQIYASERMSFKVSFVLQPEQKSLHQEFFKVVQTLQADKDDFAVFQCPTSIVTVALTSPRSDDLTKCEQRISNYLSRSMSKMDLDGFQSWDQCMINAFYQYSIERRVLPKLSSQRQVAIYGHPSNVSDAYQKYQLMNALLEERKRLSPLLSPDASTIDGFHVMLSYSPNDATAVRRLASRLIEEGFSVWTNLNRSEQFDIMTKTVVRSDCVIVCMSNSYFDDEYCEKEATYAFDSGKHIIPVKVQHYEPIEWLQKLAEKESYFQFFGSENHFDLEYDKLLLKLFYDMKDKFQNQTQRTASQSIAIAGTNRSNQLSNNSVVLYFLLTPEEKRLKYEKYVKKLKRIDKGKLADDEKPVLIKKVQEIINEKEKQCEKYLSELHSNLKVRWNADNPNHQKRQAELKLCIWYDIGILSLKQWLVKMERARSRLNITPFTFTGDVNDAVFPMFPEALQNLFLLCSMGLHFEVADDSEQPAKNKATPRAAVRPTTEIQKKIKTDDTSSQAERNSTVVAPEPTKYSTETVNNVKSAAFPANERKKTGVRKRNPNTVSNRSSPNRNLPPDYQAKFAERMLKNIYEFEQFCQSYDHALYLRARRHIRHYPTVIFGPSPFANIAVKAARKANRQSSGVEIPLKFPWNGVFDTWAPTVKRNDPSVFFSYEATSPQNN